MNRLSFDDFTYHARSTAHYLDKDIEQQFAIVHSGYNEELGELLNDDMYPVELTSKLWGLPVAPIPAQYLHKDKQSEAGDVLYFITAAGLLRNIALRDIAKEAAERYSGSVPIDWDESILSLDTVMAERMAPSVPENYRPNYHTWKMWDFAPFEDGLHIVLREPTHAKGPLRLIADGRYALERLHSTFGRTILPETSTNDEFIAAAGLALGGLSIVLQSRFDSSLEAAAIANITKRERRQERGTLVDGADPERSRPIDKERVYISDEQGSDNNLLSAPLPSERY